MLLFIYSFCTSDFKLKWKTYWGWWWCGIYYFASLFFLDRFLKFPGLPACVWVSGVSLGTNIVWSLCLFSNSLFSDELGDDSSATDRFGNSRRTLAWVSSSPWQWISPGKNHFEQVSSFLNCAEGSVTEMWHLGCALSSFAVCTHLFLC